MIIKIYEPGAKAPESLLANVEIILDGDLSGLKIAGLSIWKGKEGGCYCTMPSRKSGTGAEAQYFDYLRGVGKDSAAIKLLKQRIVEQYEREFGSPDHDDSATPF